MGNAAWVSLYAEEDEYLWFGSVFKLTLQNVFRVAENKGSTKCVRAFWFFDAILSETFHERDKNNWTDYIKKALDFCIQYTLDSNTDVFRPNKVDQFALDNWYCFCQKKDENGGQFASFRFYGGNCGFIVFRSF